MSELLQHLDEVILPILDSQPPPQLGTWNWPEIARHLRELTDKARREQDALREALEREQRTVRALRHALATADEGED